MPNRFENEMRAVQFFETGSPSSVLRYVDVHQPTPGPGEVLVRMKMASINPSDLMFIRGQYTIPANCPAIPGFEGVGVVEKSGGGLRGKLFTGKRVAVLNKKGGNWADYVVVPSEQVIPLSSALTDQQAATFFVNPATAWIMTQEVLGIPRDAWLLQTAAASSLGRMIVRLGKASGFRTLCVVRRDSQVSLLKKLGADEVVVFDGDPSHENDFVKDVGRIVGSRGVRYAIDAVGGSIGSAVVRCLGSDGHLLVYGTLSSQPLSFSPRSLMTVGSRIEGFWLGNFMSKMGLMFKLRLIRKLSSLIQSGVLGSTVDHVLPLSEIEKAVRLAEESAPDGQSGKILLQLNTSDSERE